MPKKTHLFIIAQNFKTKAARELWKLIQIEMRTIRKLNEQLECAKACADKSKSARHQLIALSTLKLNILERLERMCKKVGDDQTRRLNALRSHYSKWSKRAFDREE